MIKSEGLEETQESVVVASSFEQFIAKMAQAIVNSSSGDTDTDLFDVSVLSEFGDVFMTVAFQLKVIAYGYGELDWDARLPILASDGVWVGLLSQNDRELYRTLYEQYRNAVSRVALSFEALGCTVDSSRAT